MSDRAILHVDMDAFYASIEILENPDLAGKPVIVGGPPEKRGVVAAASYEVRKFGVHSAMSSYQARKRCPDAIFLPPRMSHYAAVSKDIFRIFREYTPQVEPLSIDEAFLDVTGSRRLFGSAPEIGRTIKKRILDETGLTASVGVAPNKFLAKLASDLEKPNGFVVIEAEKAEALLADLPIGKMWGIGKVSRQALARIGVHKVRDLFGVPRERLDGAVGSYADRLLELARGRDKRPVVVGVASKSIGAETTFEKDIADADELRSILFGLTARIARRLRKEGYRAQTANIKARYADFTTVTRSAALTRPTASTRVLQDATRHLFDSRLDRRERPLRLLGAWVSNLVSEVDEEPELFPDTETAQQEKVDHLVDSLQEKFGSTTIWRGTARPFDEPFGVGRPRGDGEDGAEAEED